MAKKRIGMSKKVRFEVFKRDSFTCQYCGKKSPDAVSAGVDPEWIVEFSKVVSSWSAFRQEMESITNG